MMKFLKNDSSIINIFVASKDVGKKNKPIYFAQKTFVESPTEIGNDTEIFDDSEITVSVNTLYRNFENDLGKLIHDFTSTLNESKFIKAFEMPTEKFETLTETIIEFGIARRNLSEIISDSEIQKSRVELLKENETLKAEVARLKNELEKLNLSKKIYSLDEIKKIVKPFAEKYHIEHVYLFGSYARGESDEKSDLDFLVYGNKNFKSTFILGFAEELREVFNKNVDAFEIQEVNQDSNFYKNIMLEKILLY